MVFDHVESVQQDYSQKGWLPTPLNLNKGVVRGLLEIYCWGLYQLYQLLESVFKQAAPKTATSEEWMEWHAEQVEAPRKQATKARGFVRFARIGAEGNLPIPAGRIVRTKADGAGQVYRYVTLDDAVIPHGANEVSVPVESETYGAAANATAGQISEQVTPVTGVDAVSNSLDWLTKEGADKEPIDKLRERYVLRWEGSNGATKHAYASWALSVPGVIAATVLDQHPRGQGTVDVIVKGAAGIPTSTLLDKVRGAVSLGAKPGEVQAGPPVNDDWQVRGPAPVNLTISGTLVLLPGAYALSAQDAAESRIRALFTDPTKVKGIRPLQIGEDVTLDRLTAAVMAVPEVKKIIWESPTEDVVVPADGLAVLAGLSLSTTMAEDV